MLSRYEAAMDQQQALQRPYDALARMLNCSMDNIAVLVSATSAWGQVSRVLCSLSGAGAPALVAWCRCCAVGVVGAESCLLRIATLLLFAVWCCDTQVYKLGSVCSAQVLQWEQGGSNVA